eukprot:15467782-Alexandrium_andersonii.AAC.1
MPGRQSKGLNCIATDACRCFRDCPNVPGALSGVFVRFCALSGSCCYAFEALEDRARCGLSVRSRWQA